MITIKSFPPFLALTLLTAFQVASSQIQVTIQHAPPIYLPQTSFWKYAVPAAQTSSGDEELDQAYRKYLYGDQLSSRAHLYKVLSRHATTPKERAVALRAASLQCLLDMGPVPDELLLSTSEEDAGDAAALLAASMNQSATSAAAAQKKLLSTRWKEHGGGTTDPWQSSWIELFDAYQQYHQGAREEAADAWKQLAQSSASEPLLKGLAWLGVARVEGEKMRTAGKAQNSGKGALFAVAQAAQILASAGDSRGASQTHVVAGEIDFLLGKEDEAIKELTAANKPFWDADDTEGWTDLNLIVALGFATAGKRADAEKIVLDMEERLGVLRVPPEQIEALVGFSRRLPGLTGMPDRRSIEVKLADAREFYRWTTTTADPLLEVISLRLLVKTLREGSYWGDASFYDSVQSDLYARYRALLPFSMRIQRAALADYDFLRQTKELEQSGLSVATNEFTPWVDTFLALKKGMRDQRLKMIGGSNSPDEREESARFSKALKEIASKGDAARETYRKRLAAGDQNAAAQAVADMFAALEQMRNFLNILDPATRLVTETENAKIEATGNGKNSYEIHSEVVSSYRFEVPKKAKVEMLHEETYLNLVRDVLASATVGDEKYLDRGVRKMVAFYDQYRNLISPAEALDVPYVFQRQIDFESALLPASTESRDKAIAEGVRQLKKQYRQKLIQDTISTDPKAPELSSSTLDSMFPEKTFFEMNWQKDDANSHTDSNQVTTTDRDGKKVVTIKHAYTAAYKLKENSDYFDLPPATSGIDIQSRTRAIRACRHGGQFPLDTLRFNKILEGFYSAGTQDVWMEKYLGVTPEQLSKQATTFSSLMDVGQLALSVQRSDDFLARPGTHPMDHWQTLVQSDPMTQTLASQFLQITDPSLMDDDAEESAAKVGHSLLSSLSKIDLAQEKTSDDDSGDQNPVRSVLHVAGMAEALRFRPLLLLLLNDRSGAEAAARMLQSKASASLETVLSGTNQPPTKEDGLSLALYFIAAGDYNRAIDQLKPLPDAFRIQDASRVFQVEYLLALCYRRAHNPAAEIASFLAAVEDLEKLRLALRTRNEAHAIQPVRQMIYEEYLNTLFEHKLYSEMANAMHLYKRSSQLPISVLQASQDNDSPQKRLVQETVFLQDVLSRDDVWQVSDAGALTALLDTFNLTPENKIDPRQTALSGLNRIADVLVDELKPFATTAVDSGSASSGGALTIFYFVGSRGLYRLVLNQAGHANARCTQISENGLSDLCSQFRSEIEERKDFLSVSTRLYEILLGELPELDNVHRLYFSLDGALNFIPFQVLKKSADAAYLVQDHVLSYLSEVPAPATNGGQIDTSRTMLLIGNPDGTLPAAEAEAKKIAELPELQSGPPLLRSDATLANLGSRLSGASFVHFATHARSNPSYPNFAYLQLADGERLYSIDLGGLPFSGKHIFLSACETRLGQVIPGEDIYGIADAFLSDGAASVISTLWRIESDSSALFAQRYYALLIQTHDPATALAMTQREFIAGKQFLDRAGTTVVLDAPLYWAGFNQLAAGVKVN